MGNYIVATAFLICIATSKEYLTNRLNYSGCIQLTTLCQLTFSFKFVNFSRSYARKAKCVSKRQIHSTGEGAVKTMYNTPPAPFQGLMVCLYLLKNVLNNYAGVGCRGMKKSRFLNICSITAGPMRVINISTVQYRLYRVCVVRIVL